MTDARRFFLSFWFLAALLTAARIVALTATPANLGPDEAQYWFWSQSPAFGYFSKPPLIAWAIAATTAAFGDAEWAVRLSAPLFHFGAAAFLYLAGRRLFDRRIAFWAGLGWITMPGVILSSFIIATDAPLLFFWSGAIYVLVRIVKSERAGLSDFAALGAMIGLGLLSKYAMIYFPAGLAVAAALTPAVRRALFRPQMAATIAIALALVTPNLLWNAQNDFQTLSHTGANANWGGDLFQPLNLLAFLAGQIAVAGPVPVAALAVAAAAALRFKNPGGKGAGAGDGTGAGATDDIDGALWRTLIILALTPLVIVIVQAFISRAHANWAASAYPSAILATSAFLFRRRAGWAAKGSVGLHAALAAAFLAAMTNFSLIDRLGLGRATMEIRGWKAHAAAVAEAFDAAPGRYDAVALDDRSLMGAVLYYERARDFTVVALDPNRSVDHHYEAFMAIDPARLRRVLFVSILDSDAHVSYRFRDIAPLGAHEVAIGGEKRAYSFFDISGYYGNSL